MANKFHSFQRDWWRLHAPCKLCLRQETIKDIAVAVYESFTDQSIASERFTRDFDAARRVSVCQRCGRSFREALRRVRTGRLRRRSDDGVQNVEMGTCVEIGNVCVGVARG